MPESSANQHVDLSESSVYGKDANENPASDLGDTATDAAIDRLEAITGGAEEPEIYEGSLAERIDELTVTTDEELDALQVNLLQDDEIPNPREGSGKIVDDLAAEQIAGLTEVGRELEDRGGASVVPGRDEPSATLRKHHPNTDIARAEDIIEGNLDEPRDDERIEPEVDEGTAA